tara:strand:+ start:118 stop:246 length:129 start_codon:yes stop_codon:yes gene_type:complete
MAPKKKAAPATAAKKKTTTAPAKKADTPVKTTAAEVPKVEKV